jgi:hypothetical protein
MSRHPPDIVQTCHWTRRFSATHKAEPNRPLTHIWRRFPPVAPRLSKTRGNSAPSRLTKLVDTLSEPRNGSVLEARMGVSLGDGEGRRHCRYPVVKQKEPGSSVWVELPGPNGHTQRRQRGSTRKCRCAQRPNTNYKSVTIELLRSNGTAGRQEAAESDTSNYKPWPKRSVAMPT